MKVIRRSEFFQNNAGSGSSGLKCVIQRDEWCFNEQLLLEAVFDAVPHATRGIAPEGEFF